ncbi:hypothetical protein EauM23_00064 [Exiguobacterium phage vB_EauM-23]|nr:hypothetical protein EauM23_00064 [Exiguobacterium phage vB_EauM-23]
MMTYTLAGVASVLLISGSWVVGLLWVVSESEKHIRRLEE